MRKQYTSTRSILLQEILNYVANTLYHFFRTIATKFFLALNRLRFRAFVFAKNSQIHKKFFKKPNRQRLEKEVKRQQYARKRRDTLSPSST